MSDAGGHKAAAKAGNPARKGAGPATRDERRAAELRSNLQRRKEQAREKARLDKEGSDGQPEEFGGAGPSLK